MSGIPEIEPILASALRGPLPGTDAQGFMAPAPVNGPRPLRPTQGGRPAAGLLLLYPRKERTHFLLTVRHRDLPSHPGQVSLPGGVQETGESLRETALRESEEEVGLVRSGVRVIGELTPVFIPVSGYRVHPFVGIRDGVTPEFRLQRREVERILEVPLEDLTNPGRRGVEERDIRDRTYRVPYFRLGSEVVWGATAMILAEFARVLEISGISREGPWPPQG